MRILRSAKLFVSVFDELNDPGVDEIVDVCEVQGHIHLDVVFKEVLPLVEELVGLGTTLDAWWSARPIKHDFHVESEDRSDVDTVLSKSEVCVLVRHVKLEWHVVTEFCLEDGQLASKRSGVELVILILC